MSSTKRPTRSCSSVYRHPPDDITNRDEVSTDPPNTDPPNTSTEASNTGADAEINVKCKICAKVCKFREHALCCDLCDWWYHQRCLGMAPAIYVELRDSTDDWFCPSCSQTKHASTTGRGQDQCSTSVVSIDPTISNIKSNKGSAN